VSRVPRGKAPSDPAERELSRIVRTIAEKFDTERIVLFGSRATGKADPESDADLLVVLRTDLSYYERGAAIRMAIWPHDLALDLLVFTPEEVAPLKADPFSFVGEILRTGKVLYRRRAA